MSILLGSVRRALGRSAAPRLGSRPDTARSCRGRRHILLAGVVAITSTGLLVSRAATITALADTYEYSSATNSQPSDTVYFLYCEDGGNCENEYFPVAGNDSISYSVYWSDQYQTYFLQVERLDLDTYVTGGRNNNSATVCFAEKQENEWEWAHHPRYSGDSTHYYFAAQHNIEHFPSSTNQNPDDDVQAGYTLESDSYWDPEVDTDIGCRSPDSGGGQEFWYAVLTNNFGN